MTMMEGSFEGASSRPILLETMVEKKKLSHECFACLSLSQTNFTTLAKSAPFLSFFDVPGAKREEGGIFGTRHQSFDCTWSTVREEGPFTFHCSLEPAPFCYFSSFLSIRTISSGLSSRVVLLAIDTKTRRSCTNQLGTSVASVHLSSKVLQNE